MHAGQPVSIPSYVLAWKNGVRDEILPYFLADVLGQTVQQELAMAVLHNPQAVQNRLLLHRALFPVDMGGIDDLQAAITVQRYVVQSHRAPAGYSAKKRRKTDL